MRGGGGDGVAEGGGDLFDGHFVLFPLRPFCLVSMTVGGGIKRSSTRVCEVWESVGTGERSGMNGQEASVVGSVGLLGPKDTVLFVVAWTVLSLLTVSSEFMVNEVDAGEPEQSQAKRRSSPLIPPPETKPPSLHRCDRRSRPLPNATGPSHRLHHQPLSGGVL